MDYLGVLILFFAPNIFGFSEVGGAPVLIPRILAAVILVQSLMTRYELGLMKVMSMRAHLMNDYLASIFLALSPWLFGFADMSANVWMPHLIAGVSIFLFSLLTEKEPRHSTNMRHAV
jgi:hypothetical protein